MSHAATSEESSSLEDEEEILMDHCPYIISFLTEFTAMAIQMYVGCMGSTNKFGMGPVIETFSFGLGRLICYTMFDHISPIHINPAKSLGFVVLGRMSLVRFVTYITAHYTGSTVAMLYLKMALPNVLRHVCLSHVAEEITVSKAFGMEFGVTFILMLAVSGATDPANKSKRDSMSLRLAFVVTVLVMSIESWTGCGKNPSRSFGPSLVYHDWGHAWLFQLAPYCGAASGAFLYRFLFSANKNSLLEVLYRYSKR